MKLKCRIHEQDYDDVVVGATFSEEYNETLDSGAVILDHILNIPNLKPYDDVFIWNADEEFNGYINYGDWINLNEYEDASVDASWVLTIGDPLVAYSSIYGNVEVFSNGINYVLRDNPTTSARGCCVDEWCYLIYKLGVDGTTHEQIRSANINFINLDTDIYFADDNTSALSVRYEIPINPSEIFSFLDEESQMHNYSLSQLLAMGIMPLKSRNVTYTDTIFVNISITQGYYDSYSGKVTHSTLSFSNSGIYLGYTAEDGYFWKNVVINRCEIHSNSSLRYYVVNSVEIVKNHPNLSITNLSFEDVLSFKKVSLQGFYEGKIVEMKFESVEDISNSVNKIAKFTFSFHSPETVEEQSIPVSFSIIMRYDETNETCEYSAWSGFIYDSQQAATILPSVNYYLGFDALSVISGSVFLSAIEETKLPSFFKHMLVGNKDKEMVDLRPFDIANDTTDYGNVYKYKIDLVSETKGLENTQLPNISITQPIVGQKRTILYYLKLYVDLYSPKIKRIKNRETNEWEYVNKYKIDERTVATDDEYLGVPVSQIFNENVFAPEMSLTNPNLRDILSRLMIVKDCIPVVKNNVIYAMDISKIHGTYIASSDHLSYVHETLNVSEYSTAYRREYQGAISQRNSTHRSEYLGFRNSGSALLTLENMYIETTIPIYKINKLYMCYYKKIKVRNINTQEEYYKIVLIKQDISQLVLENTVRNTLPADWTKYNDRVNSFAQMTNYKILTIGYDIGSNRITGWGDKYQYINDYLGWTSVTYTYIETMVDFVDGFFPYGQNKDEFVQFLAPDEILAGTDNSWENTIYSPSVSDVEGSNIATKLKTIFFQIDYIGMYNGALIHGKENTDDNDIVTTDNCSSALSILEIDGLFEKEKANRLGNESVNWHGRYDSYEQMNDTYHNVLGSEFTAYEPKTIVYHREYAIYDDCVICNFLATKEYVLKNYFTTVFAKYRTYSYASYNQCVNRADNDYYSVVISDNDLMYEEQEESLLKINNILSAFNETIINDDLTISTANQINCALISFAAEGDNDQLGKSYFIDVNCFTSGYSLCFNMKMSDPLTTGIYISELNCFDHDQQYTNYVGSAQDWYVMPVNSKSDGFLENCGFWFGHLNEGKVMPYSQLETDVVDANALYKDILTLPLNAYKSDDFDFKFGKNYRIAKDNKEIIDYTLQYELINYDNDKVLYSEWLTKLSDFNNYIKLNEDTTIIDRSGNLNVAFEVFFTSIPVGIDLFYGIGSAANIYHQLIVLRVDNNYLNSLIVGTQFLGARNNIPYYRYWTGPYQINQVRCAFQLNSIKNIDGNGNLIIATKLYHESWAKGDAASPNGVWKSTVIDWDLTFLKLTNDGIPGYTDFYCEITNQPYLQLSSNGKEICGMFQPWYTANLSVGNSEAIYFSITSSNPKTFIFYKTMYIIKSTIEPLKSSLIYEQYKLGSLPSGYSVVNVNALDVFSLTTDIHNRPCIKFNALAELGDDYKSVQYWYLDDESQGGDGYLHFVFGVNATPNDGDMTIYTSIVKSRRKIVYDYMHRRIGTVINCAKPENADKYNGQFYEEDNS